MHPAELAERVEAAFHRLHDVAVARMIDGRERGGQRIEHRAVQLEARGVTSTAGQRSPCIVVR